MGCAKAIESVAAPVAEAATAIFAPELAPVLDPIEGAVGGALTGGGKGALIGGLEGAIGGQLTGTGDLAIGATPATGPADFLGLPTGGESLGGQLLNSATNALGGVSDSLGLTSSAVDPNTGLPMASESTNAAGATTNAATGQTVAAPSATSNITPSAGSTVSAGQVGDIGANQINSLVSPDVSGASTSTSPGLGSIASNAIGAAGGSPNIIGSTPVPDNLPAIPAGTTSASSGGLSDWLPSKSDIGGAVLKNALPVGALAYDAIKGPAALPSASAAIGPGGANTAPLTAIETTNANEAATGQLTPTQQANVEQYVQSQQNQLIQQLASEGVTNPTQDSRYISGMQQIQNNALQLQQQYITAAINAAVSAGGAASSNIGTVANEQIANDTAFQDSLAAAFGALGGGSVNISQKAA